MNPANVLRSSYNKGESLVSMSGTFGSLSRTNNNIVNFSDFIYKPEGYLKAREVKQQFDDVLDNLKGIVQHVTQREEMKLRQHTGPQLQQAKNKIVSSEVRVTQINGGQETSEDKEVKNLQGDVRSYQLMMGQLRGKISQLDFQKHRERLFLEKLALINQTKKDDLTMLNKDNMQLSYEIDELMDRINAKRAAKAKRQSPNK